VLPLHTVLGYDTAQTEGDSIWHTSTAIFFPCFIKKCTIRYNNPVLDLLLLSYIPRTLNVTRASVITLPSEGRISPLEANPASNQPPAGRVTSLRFLELNVTRSSYRN
jgi:hypothetical protein